MARWRWWIHLLLIAGFPVVIGLLSIGNHHSPKPVLGASSAGLLVVCLFEIGLFAGLLGLAWLASRFSRSQCLLGWKGTWHPVAYGFGYSIALRILLAVLIGTAAAIALAAGTLSHDQLQEFLSANRPDVAAVIDPEALKHDPWYLFLSLTLVSFVLGGLREELWRVAFFAGALTLWPIATRSLFGQTIVIGAAAISFGLGHLLQGPLAVALTGLLGFGLGLIMILHRSIWPAVIAHGFFNAASFAMIPWVLDHLPK